MSANPTTPVTPSPANAKVTTEPMKTVATADVNLRNMTDDEILSDSSIIARPLAMPEQLDIKPKRPEYQFRWVQRKAGDGMWYERMKAAGFLNATKDDVEGLHESALVVDGFITVGDLILMKIEKIRYAGFIKHNYEKAQRATNRTSVHESAKSHAQQSVASAGHKVAPGKIVFYTPSAAEAEAKVSGGK